MVAYWYAIPPQVQLNMPLLHWYNLLKQLNPLRAEASLERIRDVSYPHMKDSARRSVDGELRRRMMLDGISSYRSPGSVEEYRARMLNLGIGYRSRN